MSTRASRRPQQSPSLTSIESLLLAQAAWELGAGPASWPAVAKLLSKHPLLSRPKSFFSPQSCHSMYENLMKEAALDINESNNAPHAAGNLRLAQKHYRARFQDLRELILAEESKFKTILKEIEDIRAGLWDKAGQARTSKETTPEPETSDQKDTSADQPMDDTFGGSDLSGVTESVESSSSPQTKHQDRLGPVDSSTPEIEPSAPTEVPGLDTETVPQALSPTPTADIVEEPVELVAEVEKLEEVVETSNEPITPHDPLLQNAPDSETVKGDQDQEMEDVQKTVEPGPSEIKDRDAERVKQREEEEIKDEESKEEEEEGSQGRDEQLSHEQDEHVNSPKASEHRDIEVVETESEPVHTPVADAAASVDVEPTADEGQSSGAEEPIAPRRRSTRRRKSSAASVPPPAARTRLRNRVRISESEPQNVDSENDVDIENKEDTPAIEDEVSSPFDTGTSRRRDGKRKASFMDAADSPRDKKRLREDSEPAEEEEPEPALHNTRTRVTRNAIRTEEQVALKRFQNVIGMLHSQISQHRNGTIFHNPIKNSEAPDYHEIVKRPMDLKTIKTRFKDGIIANSLEFQRDIYLMFANAMMYNRPGSDVHAMAEDMMLESEGQIIAFRQTEGLVKRGQRP
ncbi:unnamed protein product [Cyclocybe aegerita]|uniref:Bromo domain-containing protein n=1 Tax=Cyclocybe aegerita TaxID=1973307 RepID=A0A8S0WKS3_CYCAE|nr:unnamed protein product [Cyclocybe aegerita]